MNLVGAFDISLLVCLFVGRRLAGLWKEQGIAWRALVRILSLLRRGIRLQEQCCVYPQQQADQKVPEILESLSNGNRRYVP